MKPDFKSFAIPSKKMAVAVGTYRGQRVRAVAKCHPSDQFDPVKGVELAEARLDLKLVEKRIKAAQNRINDLLEQERELKRAEERCRKAAQQTVENFNALLGIKADIEQDIADLI